MSSSTSDGWGGDYSLLLQSIEGKISENIHDASAVFGTPSVDYSSAIKRRRESGGPTPSGDYSFGSAKKFRSMVELDEVLLENEQLRDQLQRMKSDHQIAREEQIRQIKFLDERCSSFKKESAERLEKYYEEKKKWQAKQRETELLLKKVTEKSSSNVAAVPPSNISSSSANNDAVLQKLRALDNDLQTKVNEAKRNMEDKLALEAQLYEVNLELKELRATHGAGSLSGEAINEARVLRKQFGDLETVHKRMAREHDVLKLKMKNQSLLEEELSSFRAKFRIAEETISALKHVQAEHQQLQGEKLLWAQLFQDILQEARDADHADMLADEDPSLSELLAAQGSVAQNSISPTQVLHVLSAYQRRCAVLLQGQGKLQQSLAEVRRQFREAVKTQRAAEDESMRLGDQLEKLEHQLRTVTQQGRMFNGEIQNLRTLLETYDSEFRIGKPEATKVFALKDQLIADLRIQLDTSRGEATDSFTRVRLLEARSDELEGSLAVKQEEVKTLQQALATATAASEKAEAQLAEQMLVDSDSASSEGVAADLMAELQTQREEARDQLGYLQFFTGLDYLPDRTRVLHMPVNPASSVPLTNTVPTVAALKVLRDEHQQLLQRVQSVEDARSTSTGSALADEVDQSVLGRANMNVSILEGQAAAGSGSGSSGSSGGGTHTAGSSSLSSADSNKLNLRLKEMFKERITSFREGVYLLTGYKMDLYAADAGNPESLPRLRLRSMFAENPEDCLMFQLRGDAPELLDSAFVHRLPGHLLQQLTMSNSVPAFLAGVTMELFENQTFMG